jgi:hypothetical protein
MLATRGRKIAAAIGGAIVVAIGGIIAAWITNAAESTTKRILNPAGAPIVVRVAGPGTFFSGHVYAPYYVVPRARVASPAAVGKSELAKMAKAEDFLDYPWMSTHGALPGSPQVVRLEVRGKGDEPVIVNAIRAKVIDRQAPVDGWYIAAPGCGAEPVRIANIDLDAPRPTVEYVDARGGSTNLALSVTRTDAELIELHAATRRATIAWQVEVFYSGPKGDGSLTVDDHGRPFRVTTEIGSDGYTPDFAASQVPSLKREHRWDKRGILAC